MSLNTDIELDAMEVKIVPSFSTKVVKVSLESVSIREILGQINLSDVVDHYGETDLLDVIGENAAKKHFGLQEIE